MRISGEPLANTGMLWPNIPWLVGSARVRFGDLLCRDAGGGAVGVRGEIVKFRGPDVRIFCHTVPVPPI